MTYVTSIQWFISKDHAVKALDIIHTASGSKGYYSFPDYENNNYGIVHMSAGFDQFHIVFNGELQVEECTSLVECISFHWDFDDDDDDDDDETDPNYTGRWESQEQYN